MVGEGDEAVGAIDVVELKLCSVRVVQEEANSEIASRDESTFHILTLLIHGGPRLVFIRIGSLVIVIISQAEQACRPYIGDTQCSILPWAYE
jgi:hypothetical protein